MYLFCEFSEVSFLKGDQENEMTKNATKYSIALQAAISISVQAVDDDQNVFRKNTKV